MSTAHDGHHELAQRGSQGRARCGERLAFSGMELVIRASAESTGGAFSIVEEIEAVDAPPHVHEHEDELFYVLEGEHVFTVAAWSTGLARATPSSLRGAYRTPSGA